MGLETTTYIDGLVVTNPTGADAKSTADDHLRLIKSAVKATFPNVTGAVTPTHTELNYVDGVTSAIQTQLDAKAPLASPALTGTPTAPTPTAGDSSTKIPTTAYVMSAISNVNAAGGITVSHVPETTVTGTAGQWLSLENGATTAVTANASPVDNEELSVIANNGLITNTVDFGAKTVRGPYGSLNIMTLDTPYVWYRFKYSTSLNVWMAL